MGLCDFWGDKMIARFLHWAPKPLTTQRSRPKSSGAPLCQLKGGRPLADFIPFTSHVTDEIIKTRDGDYLRVWRLAGIGFEAAEPSEILARHENLNQIVRSVTDGAIAFWTHKVRRRTAATLDANFSSPFCARLDEDYADLLGKHRMMVNELYLTAIWRPQLSRMQRMASKARHARLESLRSEEIRAVTALNDIGRQLEAALKRYGIEALGTYSRGSVLYSRALEFFGFLLNAVWETVPVPSGPIYDALGTARLFFGVERIEIRNPTESRFAAILDLKDYPEWSEPGILNSLLYGDYEFIETQSFSGLEKNVAKSYLERQRNQLIASGDVAVSQIEALNGALDQLLNGSFAFGEYHYCLVIFGRDLEAVADNVAKARVVFQELGFQTALVDLIPDAAWFSQLPGNWRMRPRIARISSRNFCGIVSFHNFSEGKRDGNPWGNAVSILATPSGQPFYFNFHPGRDDEDAVDEKAPGNTMIIGQTGSGKTVLELFLLAQATKFNPQIVVFDKDRGAEIAIRAMGGKYFVFKQGMDTGLNPFQMEPSERNILFWENLVHFLVQPRGTELSAVEANEISHAVRTVARFPCEKRSLTTIRQNLLDGTSNSLASRLRRWCAGGSHGWLLDNAQNALSIDRTAIYGFDYTEFLDDPLTRTPLMMILLFTIESLMDGRRFIYVMAEFWKAIGDPVFSDFVKNKQKTIRKQNGIGIFDSQSPTDALASPIARTLIEQTATFIFLPNPQADRIDYIEGLKVSETEFNLIRNLAETSRLFVVKQGRRSVLAKLDLSQLRNALDILSGTTETVALLDQIRIEVGDCPVDWMPIFAC